MNNKSTLRSLCALALALLIHSVSFGQTPKKVYSVVYYHKVKPGHTLTEARAIESEWKKIHQAEANDGYSLGWYLLGLSMGTNPDKEYNYITISNFTDRGYLDNETPVKYMMEVMGADYRPKATDLMKRTNEIKEVAKVEVWEHLDGAPTGTLFLPGRSRIWMMTDVKVKNGQYEEYMALIKKASPYYRERVLTGGASGWNFAGLLLPWGTEKAYDFSMVNQFPSMKALLESDETKGEAAFKKTMPGVDYKQYYKDLNALRETARQEIYYLMEYAVKDPAPAVQINTKTLDSYVGVYEGAFGGDPKATFTVTREGNQLFEEVTGGRKLEIIPETETRFVFRDMDAQLEFVREKSGKVMKRTLLYDGQTSEAKKIK